LEPNIQEQNLDFHYLDTKECLACNEGWTSDIHEKVRGKMIIFYDRNPKFCETPWCFYCDGDIVHRGEYIITHPAELMNEPINADGKFIKGFILISISKS